MNNLITLYQQILNLPHAIFARIDHEDAMVAIVYTITQPTGIKFILKICPRPGDFLREMYFLTHFAKTLPVPRIIQSIQPEAGIHGAILMECLPGTPLKMTAFTDKLAYEMGSLLARIHLNRVDGYGDLTQLQDINSDPRIYFAQKFEENFAECSDHLPSNLLEQCRDYYDTHLNLLTSVDGPCIIHRDFRPGNVMVHNGKLQGIIDWSSGRASFAQEDFCPLEHWEWPTNPISKKSFLAGYASIRPVPDYHDMMPLLRISRALATIGFTLKQDTWNSCHAGVYQCNHQFLESFFKTKKRLSS